MNFTACGMKLSWPNVRYDPGVCLEVMKKTTKYLSKDIRSQGRDVNPARTDCRIASHLTFDLGLRLVLDDDDDDDYICNDCIERMCKFVSACIRNAVPGPRFLDH
jgi:hypothetical protein